MSKRLLPPAAAPTVNVRPSLRHVLREHPIADSVACARLALAGIALYVAIDIGLVFLRPELSVLHSAESDYGSSGSWAWLMDANFLLRCALSLAALRAITLTLRWTGERETSGHEAGEREVAGTEAGGRAAGGHRRLGRSLLVVWSATSGLLAFFPDDPAGTPLRWHGEAHLALAFVAFVAIVAGTLLLTRVLRSLPPWRDVGRLLTACSWAALIPLLLLGHSHFGPHSLGGLYEKAFLAIELAWLLLAALPLARQTESV